MVAEAQPESEHGRHLALPAGPLCEPSQPSLAHLHALQHLMQHVKCLRCKEACTASLLLLMSRNGSECSASGMYIAPSQA